MARRRNEEEMECNMITRTMVESFHETIRGRLHKRDFNGKQIMAVKKKITLKDWEKEEITFSLSEIPDLSRNSPLVITVPVTRKKEKADKGLLEGWRLNRTLIDTGNSVDIIFYHTFKKMGLKDEEMSESAYLIHGFGDSTIKPMGDIVQ